MYEQQRDWDVAVKVRGKSTRSNAVPVQHESHREPSNAQCGLALENGGQLSIPELHRGSLFGVIAVPIVNARNVLLFRMISGSD